MPSHKKIFLVMLAIIALTTSGGYVLVKHMSNLGSISPPRLAAGVAYATSTQTQLGTCHEPTIREVLQDPIYPVDNIYVNKILKLAFWYPSGMYSEQPTISKPGDTAASLKFSNASHELLTMLIQEFPIENYPKVLPEEWGTSTEFIPPGALKYDRDRIGIDGAEVIFLKGGYRFDIGENNLSHEMFKKILNSITVSQGDEVMNYPIRSREFNDINSNYCPPLTPQEALNIPTPTRTTYVNQKFHFGFTYPAEWIRLNNAVRFPQGFYPTYDDKDAVSVLLHTTSDAVSQSYVEVSVSRTNPDLLPVDLLFKKNNVYTLRGHMVKIDGADALIESFPPDAEHVSFTRGDTLFYLTYGGRDIKAFDELLSTLAVDLPVNAKPITPSLPRPSFASTTIPIQLMNKNVIYSDELIDAIRRCQVVQIRSLQNNEELPYYVDLKDGRNVHLGGFETFYGIYGLIEEMNKSKKWCGTFPILPKVDILSASRKQEVVVAPPPPAIAPIVAVNTPQLLASSTATTSSASEVKTISPPQVAPAIAGSLSTDVHIEARSQIPNNFLQFNASDFLVIHSRSPYENMMNFINSILNKLINIHVAI